MYLVFDLSTGELAYIADQEALQHLNAGQYAWIEEPEGWSDTHYWDARSRSLVPLPDEAA